LGQDVVDGGAQVGPGGGGAGRPGDDDHVAAGREPRVAGAQRLAETAADAVAHDRLADAPAHGDAQAGVRQAVRDHEQQQQGVDERARGTRAREVGVGAEPLLARFTAGDAR
jgi:hypothetical protein